MRTFDPNAKFDAKHVNGHLVKFPDVDDKTLYYYSFVHNKWVACKPVNNLPYDMISLHLEGDPENTVVVTAKDSYRVADYDVEEEEDEDELEDLRERLEVSRDARMNFYHESAEMEFIKEIDYENDTGIIVRAKVLWTKSNGVIHIGNRGCPSINPFGYFHIESKRLEPYGTYLEPISQEQLDEEERNAQEYRRKKEIFDKKIAEIEKDVKFFVTRCNMNDPNMDISAWYSMLTKCPYKITRELVNQELERRGDKPDHTTREQSLPLLYNCLSDENPEIQYDVYSGDIEAEPCDSGMQRYCRLEPCGDAWCDIKVTNATYAVMYVGGGVPKIAHDGKYKWEGDPFHRTIEMDRSPDGTFTLSDFTIDNPLFTPVMGSSVRIYTDGNVTSTIICLTTEKHRILSKFKNSYTVSKMKDRYISLGNLWMPTFTTAFEGVSYCKQPEEKNNSDVKMSVSLPFF